MKQKKFMIKIIVILGIALLGAVGFTFMFKTKLDKQKAMTNDLQLKLSSNEKTVYVASGDKEAGDVGIIKGDYLILEELDEEGNVVTKGNVEVQTLLSGVDQASYIDESDIGKKCIVNVSVGDPIMKNMVTDLEFVDSTRKYEINTAKLMQTQQNGEFVDVRILYPDGETAVVLPKKEVLDMPEGGTYFNTYLDEKDILYYVSAMLDSYLIPGTSLYTDVYVEPNVQADAYQTYVPRIETLALLLKDSNSQLETDLNVEEGISASEYNLLSQARTNLVGYLQTLPEEQLTALNSALNTNNAGVNILQNEDGSYAGFEVTDEAADVSDEALSDDATDTTNETMTDTSNKTETTTEE